jgi:hypothetical protein
MQVKLNLCSRRNPDFNLFDFLFEFGLTDFPGEESSDQGKAKRFDLVRCKSIIHRGVSLSEGFEILDLVALDACFPGMQAAFDPVRVFDEPGLFLNDPGAKEPPAFQWQIVWGNRFFKGVRIGNGDDLDVAFHVISPRCGSMVYVVFLPGKKLPVKSHRQSWSWAFSSLLLDDKSRE